MSNDTSRLMMDLSSAISTLCPDVDMNVLPVRLEEIICNYDIQRKSDLKIANDTMEKVALYFASKKLEGLSAKTLRGYKGELQLFNDFCQKATALVTTADIRNYLASFDKAMMSTISQKLSVLKSLLWMVSERRDTSKRPDRKG